MPEDGPLPPLDFDRFFTYSDLTAFLGDLAAARPHLCRLGSIGQSREGRELHLLTITDFGTGEAEDKPAYLIHGNIHAIELAGTHAALFTARRLLFDYPRSDLLKRVAFHIVPRINPDGAEFAVRTGGSIRSRTDRSRREANTLYQEDVDGDGLILSMRQEHPDGGFVADPEDARLLVRRRADSPGPYYRPFPEGLIHDWDGSENVLVEGRGFDWNRNWSYDWRPEPEQGGSGDYPFSEPEMRSLAEFLHSRSNLFALLGYHTGPAAVLRPPSTGSLEDLDREDDQVMEDLALIGSRETGFPVVPVVRYHDRRARDINLHGHFHDFGYHHLGLFAFEFELGTMLNSAGIPTEEIFAARTEEEREGFMRRVMSWWDAQGQRELLFRPWEPFDHPQLGRVEIGAFRRSCLYNPSLSDLPRIAAGTYRFTLEHAARHPWVTLEGLEVTAVGGPVYRVRARVANRGFFPTYISNKGKSLRRLRPVRVEFRPVKGVDLLSAEGHRDLGHLEGVTGGRLLEWFLSAPEGGELGEIRVLGGTGGNARETVRGGGNLTPQRQALRFCLLPPSLRRKGEPSPSTIGGTV